MDINRVEQLQKFIQETPDDPFPKYALGLEYKNSDLTSAAQSFETLLTEHPEYLPAYYHAAEVFCELNLVEKVKHIYEQGIDLAKKQRDQKALSELQNAFQNFLFEYDH
ncbi:MAG: tetratricopeptide repeat protein [Cyclobacteriaceae bacterium]